MVNTQLVSTYLLCRAMNHPCSVLTDAEHPSAGAPLLNHPSQALGLQGPARWATALRHLRPKPSATCVEGHRGTSALLV